MTPAPDTPHIGDAAPDPGPPAAPTPAGLLVVDKPEGWPSMTVCRKVRAALVAGGAPKRAKVGHGGTLDPLATGVLVILIGKATRLCDQIMLGEKHYLAVVDLAGVSSTDDREGVRTEVNVPSPPTRGDVLAACARFVGVIQQRPPAFSAIWVDGRRSYDLARQGRPADLPPRPVTIHAIDLVDYTWPRATLAVRCGKGTYIRSLARDLGQSLGTGGMLEALRRTRVGPFSIDLALRPDQVPRPLTQAHLLDPAAFMA